MALQEYKIEEISYLSKDDKKIMEKILSKWLRNPKTLNLIAPKVTFPFNYKKWLLYYYKNDINNEIKTLVIKRNKWIIGHVSVKIFDGYGSIFHLFIDPAFRRNGFGQKLIKKIENYGQNINLNYIVVSINKKDKISIKLFEKIGYKFFEKKSKTTYYKMKKELY